LVGRNTIRRRTGEIARFDVGMYLAALAGHELGSVHQSNFRPESRGPSAASWWFWSLSEATKILGYTRGATAKSGARSRPVPLHGWRKGNIIRNSSSGLTLARRDINVFWVDIDVGAAPFKRWRPRRGRPPYGLDAPEHIRRASNHIANQVRLATGNEREPEAKVEERTKPDGVSEATAARLYRNQHRALKARVNPSHVPLANRGGRPRGRRDVH
jgi:hypothetical protein